MKECANTASKTLEDNFLIHYPCLKKRLWDAGCKIVVIPRGELACLFESDGLVGLFVLYPDHTEALIEQPISKDEVIRYINDGCLFGSEVNAKNLSITQYNEIISCFLEILENNPKQYEQWMEEISKFQLSYMEQILSSYEADSPEKKVIYDLLCYVVYHSNSGNSIISTTKEIAVEVERIIDSEIGEFLLDYVIDENTDGSFSVDCMFAGNYVPYWDGWIER